MKVPAALFEPDKSRFNGATSPTILNAIPVTDGWAPLPGLSVFTPNIEILLDEEGNIQKDEDGSILYEGYGLTGDINLPEPALGGVFVRAANGTSVLIVGTETRLWRYDDAQLTWIDISGASAPYAVTDGSRWSFALFGDVVYAQNGFDPEQMYDITSDVVFSDNATAPVCSYLATVGDYLMRGRLASNPAIVQWSSLNDPTFNDAGFRGSDVQPFPEGAGVTGVIPVSNGAIVFLRDAIETLTFTYNDFTFARALLTAYRGSTAPYSICAIGQNDFVWYALDGFFRGAGQQPIGAERVNRWVLDNVPDAGRRGMISAADYKRNIVWFRMQKSDQTYVQLGYHWVLDRWCLSDLDMTDLFSAGTAPVSLETADDIYASIDEITLPFDSSAWDSGQVDLAAINSDGYLAFANGAPAAATIYTNELSFNGVDNAFVIGGTLDSDARDFTVTAATAPYKGGLYTDRNPSSPSQRTGRVPLRANGRVARFKVNIAEGEDWTIFSGIDIEATGSGKQ